MYVYEEIGGTWTLTQKLAAGTPALDGYFGTSLALDGDVGAVSDHQGTTVVFERTGSSWTQTLEVSPGARHVDVRGDFLAVSEAGVAARGFERVGGAWQATAAFVSADVVTSMFGGAVAIAGSSLAVGARRASGVAPDTGVVYVTDLRVLPYGDPCPGAAADPTLLMNGFLSPGEVLTVAVAGGPSNAHLFLVAGTSPVQLALPGPCDLLSGGAPIVLGPFGLLPSGTLSFGVTAPSVSGVDVTLQAVLVDVAGAGAVTATNGLSLHFD